MPPSSPGLPPPAHALTRLVAELRPSIARDHAGRVQRRAVDASTLSTGLCGLRTFLRARTQGFIEPGMHVGEDLDGTPMKLSDYRGKVVVLDFWGDW